MTTIPVIYGTESGNAEMVADDICETLTAAGHVVEVVSMEDYEVTALADNPFVVVVTSTYGEGELPETAVPFHDALIEQAPDLSAVRFAAFGLGDSSYETYGNAISIVEQALGSLGATRVGEIGRHDAARGESFTDVAVAWAKTVLDQI